MNSRASAKKNGSFPTVLSHKGAMMLLVDYIKMYSGNVPMPKYNLNLVNEEQATASFFIELWDCVAKWQLKTLANFFGEVTGGNQDAKAYINPSLSWESHINAVKRLVYQIFWVEHDDDNPVIEPGAYKMWPGGFKKRGKDAEGENEMGFGKRAQKGVQKVSKKKVAKKAATKKKVTKKKVAKNVGKRQATNQKAVTAVAVKKRTAKVSKKKAATKKASKAAAKRTRKSKGVNTQGQLAPLNVMDTSLLDEKMVLLRNPEKKLRAGTVGDLCNAIPNGKKGKTVKALLAAGYTRPLIYRAVQRYFLIVKD